MNRDDSVQELEDEWDQFLRVYIQFPEPAIPTARKCFEIMLKILLIDKGESPEVPQKQSLFKWMINLIEPEKGRAQNKYWRIAKPLNDASHHGGKAIDHESIVHTLIDFCDTEVGVNLDHPSQLKQYLRLKQYLDHHDDLLVDEEIKLTLHSDQKIIFSDKGEEVTNLIGTTIIPYGCECSYCDENIGFIEFPVLPVIQVYPRENEGNDPLRASTWLANNDRVYCPHCLKNEFIPIAIETILPEFREQEKNQMERMMDDIISSMITESN